MSIYISVVSHGHDDLIISNESLLAINSLENVILVVKDNVKSLALKAWCNKNNVQYLTSSHAMGFGENNNFVFDYCKNLGMDRNDWFVTINPDVIISKEQFEKLISELSLRERGLLTINLFRNIGLTEHECSLRYFPTFKSLINLFLGKSITKSYDKTLLSDNSGVDWASGAFLIFSCDLYDSLGGFDKKYFMYYEDVDICYRARKEHDVSVVFLKNVLAYHEGAYQNRNVFSKHFRWYMKSLLTFLMRC